MKRVLSFRLSILLLICSLNAAPLFADSVTTHERTVTKVSEGIYVIRHPDAPDSFPQGNTTVIIGEREVLVVDSCLLPSSTKEDIKQIRQWTNKPVRYLVNTHWHFDHTNGNALYAEAFPGLSVIAQVETQKMIQSFNPTAITSYSNRTERFKRYLETGKDGDGNPISDAFRKDLTNSLNGIDSVVAEFKNLTPLAPNVTFDHELSVNLGNREVQIRFLGRGNTAGDTVIFLPKEKIVIVGDLLDHPVPYFYGGFPLELAATLQRIAQLDAQTIIPGHGDIQHDKTYLTQVIGLVDEVVAVVLKEVNTTPGRKLEEVQQAVPKAVDLAAWRQKFAGNDQENRDNFDASVESLIKVAYKQAMVR
ncbi:MAG: MBL fold metallo-hydrolase [Acidobacteria bacterium]|nr:MBL fold metallo-hydrolase [Acidobacteriota bacterium]